MNAYLLFNTWSTIRRALVLCALAVPALQAQQAGPPSQAPAASQLPAYRPPAFALVQPPAGGSVPQDRPVVVFRFAPGEPNDPIDTRSFVVSVDGEDRTSLFQIAPGEAWGPLASSPIGAAIAVGAHHLAARVCSARGTCSEVTAVVTVAVSPAALEAPPPGDRRRSFIDVLLAAARKLLNP